MVRELLQDGVIRREEDSYIEYNYKHFVVLMQINLHACKCSRQLIQVQKILGTKMMIVSFMGEFSVIFHASWGSTIDQ